MTTITYRATFQKVQNSSNKSNVKCPLVRQGLQKHTMLEVCEVCLEK